MSTFAQSIQRLYNAGKLTKAQVKARYDKGQLTEYEYKVIIGEIQE